MYNVQITVENIWKYVWNKYVKKRYVHFKHGTAHILALNGDIFMLSAIGMYVKSQPCIAH